MRRKLARTLHKMTGPRNGAERFVDGPFALRPSALFCGQNPRRNRHVKAMEGGMNVTHGFRRGAVHAVVVLKSGAILEPAELIAFCKKRIGGYKCPRSVDVRTEPLPMSGAGKILKRELRRPFWEDRKREVA
jgi:hypothetical protein